MGWRVEVGGDGESEAYQRHESGDGVDDKDGGEGMSRGRGQREVGVGAIAK